MTLDDGEIFRYDRLLIATGARNRRFPIPGLDLPGVYDLRTVGDAERIRSEMAPGRKVVVSGLGFIGSEVTASLRRRGLEVTAIDGMRTPLERVLGADVGGVMSAIHRDQGVELVFEDRVASFEGSPRVERISAAEVADDRNRSSFHRHVFRRQASFTVFALCRQAQMGNEHLIVAKDRRRLEADGASRRTLRPLARAG